MKLSLTWIFDHIDAQWTDYESELIVSKFNQITAEIEHFYQVTWDLDHFFIAQLSTPTSTYAYIPELQKEITLSRRVTVADFVMPYATNIPFLVKQVGTSFVWATLSDFGVSKEGVLPAFLVDEQDLKGAWRKKFESRDVIFEVDNKSITHRPDMWGHRGFAREIAAFLKLPLKPAKDFLTVFPVQRFEKKSSSTEQTPFVIDNQAPRACRMFNGLYFPEAHNSYSTLFMASRLLKIGSRPINALVDATNYVMNDWGNPLHAYDAEKILDKQIIVRMAKEEEKLHLLDDHELVMTAQDLVIANGQNAMCLAGVKGGMYDSINVTTRSIFLEGATFDAGFVRRSALKHKTRTDASARFEKTLDPNQSLETMFRFVQVLKEQGIQITWADEIVAVGVPIQEETVLVEHEFLEKRSGLTLTSADVVDLLGRLEFKVAVKAVPSFHYSITIPTFRTSKDIKTKEDILEEVIRLYGFEKVPHILPLMNRLPFDLLPLKRIRIIRQFFAHAMGMIEQQNDALFDEQFLASINYQISQTVSIVNPVSENFQRLATSLIPGLLKNVQENFVHHDMLRFFEVARVWQLHKHEVGEKKNVSGIFFEKRKEFDFYQGKYAIMRLFNALGLDGEKIEWHKLEKPHDPWYRPYQTAELMYSQKKVGKAGKVDPAFIHVLGALPESDAFIFELDADFLIHTSGIQKRYQQISRFQETFFDLSFLVPLSSTSKTIQTKLAHVSPLVTSVQLIDFFEKESWTDVRSLTFRIWLGHQERTLEREEIEQVRQEALNLMALLGAQIRA